MDTHIFETEKNFSDLYTKIKNLDSKNINNKKELILCIIKEFIKIKNHTLYMIYQLQNTNNLEKEYYIELLKNNLNNYNQKMTIIKNSLIGYINQDRQNSKQVQEQSPNKILSKRKRYINDAHTEKEKEIQVKKEKETQVKKQKEPQEKKKHPQAGRQKEKEIQAMRQKKKKLNIIRQKQKKFFFAITKFGFMNPFDYDNMINFNNIYNTKIPENLIKKIFNDNPYVMLIRSNKKIIDDYIIDIKIVATNIYTHFYTENEIKLKNLQKKDIQIKSIPKKTYLSLLSTDPKNYNIIESEDKVYYYKITFNIYTKDYIPSETEKNMEDFFIKFYIDINNYILTYIEPIKFSMK